MVSCLTTPSPVGDETCFFVLYSVKKGENFFFSFCNKHSTKTLYSAHLWVFFWKLKDLNSCTYGRHSHTRTWSKPIFFNASNSYFLPSQL